jgi:chloramphenicol 3-O-phosphotransferase
VHLDTDRFYDFVVQPISPILPESRAQNETVMAAAAHAGVAFAEGGYDVFVDGVIGPWMLPIWTRALVQSGTQLDYIVLRASLEETLRRSNSREKRIPDEIVRHMHGQLASLGAFERHVVATSGLSPEQTLAEISHRRASGELRLKTPAGGS